MAVARIPDERRSDRIVFQATLLPNYLAASWFPNALFEAADIAVIGSRPVTAPYRTEHGPDTTSLSKAVLLAGTDASLAALDRLAAAGLETPRDQNIGEAFQRIHAIQARNRTSRRTTSCARRLGTLS
jgi:hypothetical protein